MTGYDISFYGSHNAAYAISKDGKIIEGNPDKTKEQVKEEAPGTCVIFIMFFIHSFTNL